MSTERKMISYYTVNRRTEWQGNEDTRSSAQVHIFVSSDQALTKAREVFPEPLNPGEFFVALIVTLLLTEEEKTSLEISQAPLNDLMRLAQNKIKFVAKIEQRL